MFRFVGAFRVLRVWGFAECVVVDKGYTKLLWRLLSKAFNRVPSAFHMGLMQHPDTPISLNQGKYITSYEDPYYNLRPIS